MAPHLKVLVTAIATVAAENLTLPISTMVEVIEDSLIAADQGDEDDSALACWFLPER